MQILQKPHYSPCSLWHGIHGSAADTGPGEKPVNKITDEDSNFRRLQISQRFTFFDLSTDDSTNLFISTHYTSELFFTSTTLHRNSGSGLSEQTHVYVNVLRPEGVCCLCVLLQRAEGQKIYSLTKISFKQAPHKLWQLACMLYNAVESIHCSLLSTTVEYMRRSAEGEVGYVGTTGHR